MTSSSVIVVGVVDSSVVFPRPVSGPGPAVGLEGPAGPYREAAGRP